MKKIMLLAAVAVTLCGCYGYGTTRTIKAGDKECEYTLNKEGNAVIGYHESNRTNENRSEKECREWLKK